MSDETQEPKPLEEGTPPAADAPKDRMAKARAAKKQKAQTKKNTVEVPLSLLETMQRQIADLQAQAIARDARPNLPEADEADVARAVAAGEVRQPGAVINISPGSPVPELRKIKWTRKDLETLFPMVEITPEFNLWVAPHNVGYQLLRRHRRLVPSIVRDAYEAEIARLENPFNVPGLCNVGPLTLQESYELASTAMTTGQPALSRLHFTGTGLRMSASEGATEPEAPAAPAQAKS